MTDRTSLNSERSSDEPTDSVCVVFAGGGSGGHLTPAIALGEMLVEHYPQVRFHFVFLCSAREVDQKILHNLTIEGGSVEIIVQRVTSSGKRMRFAGNVVKDIATAVRQFHRLKPRFVVGMGGFASIAGVVAGRLRRTPVCLMDLNVVPGKATRRLATRTTLVWGGWSNEEAEHSPSKALHLPLGIPLRKRHHCAAHESTTKRKTLLIVGGSLGAARLNDMTCSALADCRDLLKDWDVVHQTGTSWHPTADQENVCSGLNWQRAEFIQDLPKELDRADVVISRAGAMTLGEIARARVPAILVPLSTSADDHQTVNAKSFAAGGAAVAVGETKPSDAAQLAEHLRNLISREDKRKKMRSKMKKWRCLIASRDSIALLGQTMGLEK